MYMGAAITPHCLALSNGKLAVHCAKELYCHVVVSCRRSAKVLMLIRCSLLS